MWTRAKDDQGGKVARRPLQHTYKYVYIQDHIDVVLIVSICVCVWGYRAAVKAVLLLLPILGLTWLCGILVPFSIVMAYIFIILSSLQVWMYTDTHLLTHAVFIGLDVKMKFWGPKEKVSISNDVFYSVENVFLLSYTRVIIKCIYLKMNVRPFKML